jgi:hypothetical protein
VGTFFAPTSGTVTEEMNTPSGPNSSRPETCEEKTG